MNPKRAQGQLQLGVGHPDGPPGGGGSRLEKWLNATAGSAPRSVRQLRGRAAEGTSGAPSAAGRRVGAGRGVTKDAPGAETAASAAQRTPRFGGTGGVTAAVPLPGGPGLPGREPPASGRWWHRAGDPWGFTPRGAPVPSGHPAPPAAASRDGPGLRTPASTVTRPTWALRRRRAPPRHHSPGDRAGPRPG